LGNKDNKIVNSSKQESTKNKEDKKLKEYKNKTLIRKHIMKDYPHLFLKYLHNINEFYNNNKTIKLPDYTNNKSNKKNKNKNNKINNTKQSARKFKYTAKKNNYKGKNGKKKLKRLRNREKKRKKKKREENNAIYKKKYYCGIIFGQFIRFSTFTIFFMILSIGQAICYFIYI